MIVPAGPWRAVICAMHHRGFTLVEVIVSLGILCTAALGGLQLVAVATEMMEKARAHAIAASLASERMEQLRSLRFEFDGAGARQTDVTTSLSTDPPGAGGTGLTPAGPATLDVNVRGFVDHLDARGTWVGGGPDTPAGATFVRRWSIEPAGADPDLLVLQVLVRPASAAGARAARRTHGEARYVTLRARVRR